MKIDVQDSFGKVVESIKLDSKIFNGQFEVPGKMGAFIPKSARCITCICSSSTKQDSMIESTIAKYEGLFAAALALKHTV